MDYVEICKDNYQSFRDLAVDYYRDGEDADTPEEELDSFIQMLFEMIDQKQVFGYLALSENEVIGFVLWGRDDEQFAFSELPGYGTIMEIGIVATERGKSLGRQLVSFAESKMKENGLDCSYVSAYGPAQKFWASCGYIPNGRMASNELALMVKDLNSSY